MFKDSKIFILGMARSGYEVAKYLSRYNNEILIVDAKEQENDKVKELENLGVKVTIDSDASKYLDETYKVMIKNPGIKYTHDAVVKANNLNIPVVNEVEVASYFFPEDLSVVGITGSNGKTTTTNLIYEILKASGKKVIMAGNMGIPVCGTLDKLDSNTILVLEISVQQLCNMKHFKTNVSVLTNLSPTHIDFVDSYENYLNIKKKIFNNHTNKDLAIINLEDKDSMDITKDINSTKVYFSSKKDSDLCIRDNAIYYHDELIIKISDIKLKGMHNYENIMCAIGATKYFNVSNESIINVLSKFNGVEHRLEYVRSINNIVFYNDSKATNTVSTRIALDSFKEPTILIMGGLDRGHSFEPLNYALKHTKLIICYGQTKERIKDWATSLNIPVKVVDNLSEATNYAYEQAVPNDVVLLSPACASWDQYKCFEDRGTEFKNIVNSFKE